MWGTRRSAVRTAFVATVAGAVVMLAACAPDDPETQPSPSPSPTVSTPAPYDGPLVFVGDELDSLLLSAAEISQIVPDASDVSAPTDVLGQISDGGGAPASPAICDILYAEQSLGSVGARDMTWTVPDVAGASTGHLRVLQFADESAASARMDHLLRAANDCAQFTKEAPATFDAVVLEEKDGVRAMAGTLVDVQGFTAWRSFQAFATVGNVLLELSQPAAEGTTADAQAAAELLQQRAIDAGEGLVQALTTEPPVREEQPAADAAQTWADWQIGIDGVGPIMLGDTVDAAVAAAGGEAAPPSYAGGPWVVTNAEDTGSLSITPAEQGDAVWYITVGAQRAGSDEALQDGDTLPSRGGIRVGTPVSEAISAYPDGTIYAIVSSAQNYYAVTTRDGRQFRFDADRAAADGGAIIIGITVEDATQRVDLGFG